MTILITTVDGKVTLVVPARTDPIQADAHLLPWLTWPVLELVCFLEMVAESQLRQQSLEEWCRLRRTNTNAITATTTTPTYLQAGAATTVWETKQVVSFRSTAVRGPSSSVTLPTPA